VTTAPQPRFIERGTSDKAKLLKTVELIAPERGAGRFVESLDEATQRVEREKDSVHTIVAIGTSSGDTSVRDADVKRILERSARGRFRLFAVLLMGSVGTTLGGGGVQTEVGDAVAKNTGGRFEKINVPSRLATLLPEIGAEMAKTLGSSTRQFRLTVDRPAGMSGNLGQFRLSLPALVVSSVTVESR
jgi:hypothetical protein